MATKDYRYTGNALRYRFTREHPPKPGSSTEYMPSILAISADVIDLSNRAPGKLQCRMGFAHCYIHENCDEDSGCGNSRRIFYIYHKEHLSILQPPEKLDDNLKIDNHYAVKEGNPLCELCKKGVYELAFLALYRYYEVIPWNMCYWHIDYYEEILASIFLFCPKVLCCAMKNELNAPDMSDMYVTSAIRKCLDFSIRLDRKIEEERQFKKKKERAEFYEKILNEIIGFHILRDVEIAITEDVDQASMIGDVVKKVMEVSSDVVSETRRRVSEWSEQNERKNFEKNLKKLIGTDSYNYIYGRYNTW